jgi:hypothetical protein
MALIAANSFEFLRIIEVNRETKKIVWEYTDNPPHNFLVLTFRERNAYLMEILIYNLLKTKV